MLDKRAALLSLVLVLAACGNSSEPTGQVVATVNGDEITTTDLDAELNGASASTPEQQKMMQRAALDNIINRKILAQAAESDGLNKGPKAAVLMEKAKDLALIELYNEKMRSGIPAPSDDEIQAFVSGNPTQFAQHRMFVVDQIVVPQATQALVKALEPVKSLAEAERVLAAQNVRAISTVGVIDSLTIPSEAAKADCCPARRRGVHHPLERRNSYQPRALFPGCTDPHRAGHANRARNADQDADRGADA